MPKVNPDNAAYTDPSQDLEAIFDLTVVGLARLRDRVIVRCNRHMEELFGFEPGEMLGQSTRIWYCSEEDYRIIGGSAYPDLAAGRVHHREQYFCRRDGSKFWGRIAGRALDSANPMDCVLLIEDITQRKLADERLQQVLSEQQLIFDNAAVGIMFIRNRVIQRCNRRIAEIMGYRIDQMLGESTERFFPDGQAYQQFGESMMAAILQHGIFSAEIEVRRSDGGPLWVQVTGRRIDDDDDGMNIIWIIEDVNDRHRAQVALAQYQETLESRVAERTAELADANRRLKSEILERRKAEERIWHVANHDALTGLPNRYLFRDRLTRALAQAQRHATKVALVFVDIDRFKSINDTLGHDLGDRLLQQAAKRLQEMVRAEDTVARLGGDEFVVVLEDIKSIDEISDLTERMRCSLLPPVHLDGHALHMSASFGVSLFPDHTEDSEVLMRNADTAMYHAKSAGRNTARLFTPSMNVAVSQFFEIESRLPGALEAGEFELYYQPSVSIADGSVVAMEALIRWNREGRCISPAEFIPVAEESGLILPIGSWVLREACRQAMRWLDAGFGALTIAVNLSARQFREPDLALRVKKMLDETGLPPHCLELEITESTLMDQVDDALMTLQRLSNMGFVFK